MGRILKAILVALGFLFMGLGMVGTFVPILPTVPFLIAAAFCFARGSRKFHRWFSSTKVYKEHLQSFVEHRAMTRKQKIRALGLMTVMILIAMCFVPAWQGKVCLGAIILGNYLYFALGIKTITQEQAEQQRREGEKQDVSNTGSGN